MPGLKTIFALMIFLTTSAGSLAQEKLRNFTNLEVGQHINLWLVNDDQSSITTDFHGIDPDELVIEQRGKRLLIYLKRARHLEKQVKQRSRNGWKMKTGYYGDGYVNATVNFRTLKSLIVKGEQDVHVQGAHFAKRFKLKLFGEPTIVFDEMYTERFVTTTYGECQVNVHGGHADVQKHRFFGDSEVNTELMSSDLCRVLSFGESALLLNTEEIRVKGFGELEVDHVGSLRQRGFVIGESHYREIR